MIIFIGDLFVKFFKFYSELLSNARENVYAIHTMKTIKRYELHPELTRTEFIIQDPFKLSHNVSQNVNQSGLNSIHQKFQCTYQHLAGLNGAISLTDILKVSSQKKDNTKKQPQLQNQSKTKSPEVYIIPLPKESNQIPDVESCASKIERFLVQVLQMSLKDEDTLSCTESISQRSNLASVSLQSNDGAPVGVLNSTMSAETITTKTTTTIIAESTPISTTPATETADRTSNISNSMESTIVTLTTNTALTTTTVVGHQNKTVFDGWRQLKKRKAENLFTENILPSEKKAKKTTPSHQSNYDKKTFTCIAYRETWLSRRKDRKSVV